MLYIIIIVLGFTIIGGIIKFFRTRELSSKLGRKIADHELVSINSWIKAEENVERQKNN
jgi:hypothetical protein